MAVAKLWSEDIELQAAKATDYDVAWDYPDPFVMKITVGDQHTDLLQHTNNIVYLAWMEDIARSHAEAIDGGWDFWTDLGIGCVARKHEIEYLTATVPGDEIIFGTWCTGNDQRLNLTRGHQMIRVRDGKTVVRATTHWIPVNLKTGRPCRMPAEFKEKYRAVQASTEAK